MKRINLRILRDLEIRLGAPGKRAKLLIEKAQSLLDGNVDSADSYVISYLVREALSSVMVFGRVTGESTDNGLKKTVDAITAIVHRFEISRDSERTVQQIIEIVKMFNESTHSNHEILTRIIEWSTSHNLPMSARRLIEQTVDIRHRSSQMLHGDPTEHDVRALWNDFCTVLETLFPSPELLDVELFHYANVETPTVAQIKEVANLLTTSERRTSFFRFGPSLQWILGLDEDSAIWPIHSYAEATAVAVLLREHLLTNETQIRNLLSNWRQAQNEEAQEQILLMIYARVGGHVAEDALPLVDSFLSRGLANWDALDLIEVLDPTSNSYTWYTAILWNAKDCLSLWHTQRIAHRLTAGVTQGNIHERLRMVVKHLSQLGNEPRSAPSLRCLRRNTLSLPQFENVFSHVDVILMTAGVLARIASEHIDITSFKYAISDLDDLLTTRLRAIYLSNYDSLTIEQFTDLVLKSMHIRDLSADDLILFNRIDGVELLSADLAVIRDVVRTKYLEKDVTSISTLGTWRACLWKIVFDSETYLVPQVDSRLLTFDFEKHLTDQSRTFEMGSSPIPVETLRYGSIVSTCELIRSWEPGTGSWLQSPRELGRAIEEVTRERPTDWLDVMGSLQGLLVYPTYICHVLLGLQGQGEILVDYVDQIANLVVDLTNSPVPPRLTVDDHTSDRDWTNCHLALLNLIIECARYAKFAPSTWSKVRLIMLELCVKVEDLPESITSDLLSTAINCGPTQTFDRLLILFELSSSSSHDLDMDVRKLLEWLSNIDGSSIAFYFAILLTRASQFGGALHDLTLKLMEKLFQTHNHPDVLPLVSFACNYPVFARWLIENQPGLVLLASKNSLPALRVSLAEVGRNNERFKPQDLAKKVCGFPFENERQVGIEISLFAASCVDSRSTKKISEFWRRFTSEPDYLRNHRFVGSLSHCKPLDDGEFLSFLDQAVTVLAEAIDDPEPIVKRLTEMVDIERAAQSLYGVVKNSMLDYRIALINRDVAGFVLSHEDKSHPSVRRLRLLLSDHNLWYQDP